MLLLEEKMGVFGEYKELVVWVFFVVLIFFFVFGYFVVWIGREKGLLLLGWSLVMNLFIFW